MRKEIIEKTIAELVYVANDGTVFKNKRCCEAYEKELSLVRSNIESFKNRIDYNTVMVYEGEEKILTEAHGVPCGRVIFNWRNYK